MPLPARHRHRFPIPSHSSVHATRHFSLTPLFVALPSISRLTPLATAFTHRGPGVWVASRFSPLTAHYPLPTLPSLCFHHLTNPFFRNSFVLSSMQIPRGCPPPRQLHKA